VQQKKSQIYKAAVTGDTVGDPLKDTSGPALNILMKLMAIISVVFAPLFMAVNNGGGLIAYLDFGTMTAVTTNLVAMPGSAVHVAGPQTAPVFTALVFAVGAFAGMGGSLFARRVANTPPKSMVNRKSLQEPLLVARATGLDGTDLAATTRRISA